MRISDWSSDVCSSDLDAEGRIIDFTDRWLESSGLERDEAEGSGWLSATHPDDIEPVTRRVAQSHATGEPFDVRVRLMVNDQYRWLRSQAYPRRGEEGRERKRVREGKRVAGRGTRGGSRFFKK